MFVHTPNPELKFNPQVDICPVQPYGSVYLPEAFAKNSIPSDVQVGEENYNGIDKPESILGKPRDVFEAAQIRQTLSDYEPPKAE